MPPDKAHRDFAQAALPLNWYEVAKLLHENARTLHATRQQSVVVYSDGIRAKQRPTTNRAVFLLSAFALENLIKAFLIYENPAYIEGGKLSRKLLNAHKLSELQKACKKIPSPIRTRFVFEVLEAGISSWARYPCSTAAERETEELAVTPEFWTAYNKVFDLYSQRLESLLEKLWTGPYGERTRVEFRRG